MSRQPPSYPPSLLFGWIVNSIYRLYGMVGCAAEYHYKMLELEIKSASYSSLIITHVSMVTG